MILLQEAESHFHGITEIAAEQFHVYQGSNQLMMFHKNTFKSGGVQTEGVIRGTSKQDSFDLNLMVRSMFRRTPKHEQCTCTPASGLVSNTTAKRRGIAKMLLGQFREVTAISERRT